jgi:hypothetical protein
VQQNDDHNRTFSQDNGAQRDDPDFQPLFLVSATCDSLALVTIEHNSQLHQIGEAAFACSRLTTIQVPASVELLCKKCLCRWRELTSAAN